MKEVIKPFVTEKVYNSLGSHRIVSIIGAAMSGKTHLFKQIAENNGKNCLFIRRIGITEINSMNELIIKIAKNDKKMELFKSLIDFVCSKLEIKVQDYHVSYFYCGKLYNQMQLSSNVAALVYICANIIELLYPVASDKLRDFEGILLIDNFDGIFSDETFATDFIAAIAHLTKIRLFVSGYRRYALNEDITITITMKEGSVFGVGTYLNQ